SPVYAAKVQASADLTDLLAATAGTSDPWTEINGLFAALDARGVRWATKRRYPLSVAGDVYLQKDIDLFVHPDDLHSLIDISFAQGFFIYHYMNFVRYCGATGQAVFIQADPDGIAPRGNLSVPSMLERRVRAGGHWRLSDIDQCAVHLDQAA